MHNVPSGSFYSNKTCSHHQMIEEYAPSHSVFRRYLRQFLALASLFFFTIILFFAHPAACKSQRELDEYTIKAGLLAKLLSFVEWPDADAETTMTIIIIGHSPLEKTIMPISKNIINGRQLKVHILPADTAADQLKKCQVLFLSASLKPDTRQAILRSLNHTPVLTVSDTKNFLEMGGMINFVPLSRKIGFEINRTAAGRAGLIIRSRLLRLATRIVE